MVFNPQSGNQAEFRGGDSFTFASSQTGLEDNPLQMAFVDTLRPPSRSSEIILAQANTPTLANYTLPDCPEADRFSSLLKDQYDDPSSEQIAADVGFLDLSVQAMTSPASRSVAITHALPSFRAMIANADSAWQQNQGEQEGYLRLYYREHMARILEMGSASQKREGAAMRAEVARLAGTMRH